MGIADVPCEVHCGLLRDFSRIEPWDRWSGPGEQGIRPLALANELLFVSSDPEFEIVALASS